MAPTRKSNESEKEKNDSSHSENEAEENSDAEPIKKSSGKKEEADDNENPEENGDDEDKDDDENGTEEETDDDAPIKKRKVGKSKPATKKNDENENGTEEETDDDAPIKKRKVGKSKPATKKKPGKTTASKKKAAAAKATTPKKPVEEGEKDEEYEVKEVIDSKKEKNVVYYLIRWKGYTSADDTWERATDLSCDDLIAAFNKKPPNKKATPAAKQPPKKRKNEDEDEDADPEKEYEVEKITSMCENKKGKQFRIRWKGFKSGQDTWEPEENLNCKDLIEKFLKKHKEQSQYSTKSLREDPKRTKRLVNEFNSPRARSSKRSSVKARKTYYSEDDNSE